MKHWTPEAEQRLETYLDEVLALAHSNGDADSDFVDDLRLHIRSDVEQTPDGVITPQRLERALAAVGTPRDVIGVDAPVYVSNVASLDISTAPKNGNGHTARNGNGHAEHNGNGQSTDPKAERKPTDPNAAKIRFGWCVFGGIVLPLIAILVELCLIANTWAGGIGVMPTFFHLALLLAVPAGFFYLIQMARRDVSL